MGPVTAPAPGKGSALGRVNLGDRVWGAVLTALGASVLLVAGLIVLELRRVAHPALQGGVAKFVRGTDWDPVQDSFGALPFIYGTLVTSAVALVVAVPVALGVAVFVTELAP